MNKKIYTTLAKDNIKKNPRTYVPFLILSITSLVIFFIIHALSVIEILPRFRGGIELQIVLKFGVSVVGIFATIIIFYGNSFISKKRNQNLGVYSILGMEKKHITYILFLEYFYMLLITLVVGIIIGLILNQFALLILLKLLGATNKSSIGFSIPTIFVTIILFSLLFLATALLNIAKINTTNPIELLKSEDEGEREPQSKWLLAIVGSMCLLSGYYIAVTVASSADTFLYFCLAVILVIIGTFSLFSFGSTVILKSLQKSKSFYYKKNNFISISGMIYRLKQNAAGLASICILSTCILIILSTTTSLFIGIDSMLKNRFLYELNILINDADQEKLDLANKIIETNLTKNNLTKTNVLEYKQRDFQEVEIDNDNVLKLIATTVDEYNKFNNTNYDLKDNEALVYSSLERYKTETVSFLDKEFLVKEFIERPIYFGEEAKALYDPEKLFLVVKNEYDILNYFNIINDSDIKHLSNTLSFDLEGSADKKKAFGIETRSPLMALGNTYSESRSEASDGIYALYSGLLFLGVFLGILFLLTTVIIIYYKQISEGYQDKKRFEIMRNVGMSDLEVKSAINRQVVQIFYIPLILSFVHIFFAFPMIAKILAALHLTDVPLFIWCTIATSIIFSIIYAIVYAITSKTYYKIVSSD